MTLSTFFICPFCLPGVLASDREAFAKRWNIRDDLEWLGACLLTMAGCGLCLLCQSYATLKMVQTSSPDFVVTQVTPVYAVPPQQQVMAIPTGTYYG